MIYDTLGEANAARQRLWDPDSRMTSIFHALELAGEVGETLNIMKKLERERLGLMGSRSSRVDLADELADIAIVLDLLASRCGVDLASAIRRKFNETSRKNGFPVELR